MTKTARTDKWFYPDELEIHLEPYGVQREKIAEIITQSWELNRCIVPEFSNWDRYMALTRLGVIAYVADYTGRAIDVVDDGPWIGYDIEKESTSCSAGRRSAMRWRENSGPPFW